MRRYTEALRRRERQDWNDGPSPAVRERRGLEHYLTLAGIDLLDCARCYGRSPKDPHAIDDLVASAQTYAIEASRCPARKSNSRLVDWRCSPLTAQSLAIALTERALTKAAASSGPNESLFAAAVDYAIETGATPRDRSGT